MTRRQEALILAALDWQQRTDRSTAANVHLPDNVRNRALAQANESRDLAGLIRNGQLPGFEAQP